MSKKKKSISIALINISDIEFHVKEPSEKLKKNFKKESLQLGININFSPNADQSNLILYITIIYKYPIDGDVIELLKSAFAFEFKVTSNEQIVTIEESKVVIPDDLAINLVSISLSTIRGLIAAKTRGNFINKFYFPIVSPENLISLISKDKV